MGSRSRSGSRPRKRSRSGGSRSRSRTSSRSRSYSRTRSRSRSDNDKYSKKTYVTFIRNLDPDVREEDLRAHFEDCGPITSTSIINDRRSGFSKGFGFVAFGTEEARKNAIETKNGKPLFDKYLVVQKSTRKTTIYVGNLPHDFEEENDAHELKTILERECGKKILSLRTKGKFAFCEFLNFESTQAALQRLPGVTYRGRELRIQLANSDPANDGQEERNDELKRTLFIRNISPKVGENELRSKFEKFGPIIRCEIIRDKQGEQKEYGFIGFKEKNAADTAYRDMHRAQISGYEISVEFAKAKTAPRRDGRDFNRNRDRGFPRDHRGRDSGRRRMRDDRRIRDRPPIARGGRGTEKPFLNLMYKYFPLPTLFPT